MHVLGWGKPLGYEPQPYHAIVEIDFHGSVATACRGRWPFSDAWKLWELFTPTFVKDPPPERQRLALIDRWKLAIEEPGGFFICGTVGKIEWLYKRRAASAKGGEATKRNAGNKTGPHGRPSLGPPPVPNTGPLNPDPESDPESGGEAKG